MVGWSDEERLEKDREEAYKSAAAHLVKASAHFQAGRFNEGMTELVGATTCYEAGKVWNEAASIREVMAERNLSRGTQDNNYRASLDLGFAVGNWVSHGQDLEEQGRMEEACESFTNALDAANRSVKINPLQAGMPVFKLKKSNAEKAIEKLKCH